MTLLAFASLSGSPGVTTTAVVVGGCSPRRALVVEADPFGSALAARFALAPRPGLATLAASRRERSPDAVWGHAQVLPGGLEVLVGLPSIAQTPALGSGWGDLAEDLVALDGLAVADVGRLLPGPPAPLALVKEAHALGVVIRPELGEVSRLRASAGLLRRLNPNLGLVLVGERPYGPEEVARASGIEAWGVLAFDPAAAALVGGQAGRGRALRRSALVRSAAALVAALDQRLGSKAQEPPVESADAEGAGALEAEAGEGVEVSP